MRLFTKIFVSVITVFSVAFLVSGYFLLSYSLETCVDRELKFALRQYKYDKFSVQAGMIANEEELLSQSYGNQEKKDIFAQLTQEVSEPVCFLSEKGTVLYAKDMEAEAIDAASLTEDSYWYQVVHREDEDCILIGSRIVQDDLSFAFLTKTDITEAICQQKILQKYFERCFTFALAAGALLIFGLSFFLTNPIKRMTEAADRIANGCYHERLQVSSRDEIGELADSFNRMTAAVEKTISDLAEEAEKKEDFVANFAHELKTPLTSVVGYADMLYHRNLPREEVKKSAWYIWNEGMRLESLSFKLMDLTNLNRQKIVCQDMPAKEFLADAVEGLDMVLAQKGIEILYQADEAYVKADYDLLKTLILNLIDNAGKADCRKIRIEGKKEGQTYRMMISDDGRGIPESELSRITEAFYMVDKSRSRMQHSAGLGLALVKRIAEIHGGTLLIESKEGVGTKVTVCLSCAEGGDTDE